MTVPSYGKVAAIGHRSIPDLFDGPYEVTEKLDGSAFGFGIGYNGELCARSKNKQIDLDGVQENDLFYPAVQSIKAIHEANRLREGWWYYGEAFKKPKHSTLTYDRVPEGNIALYGAVLRNDERAWLRIDDLHADARAMGLEAVQELPDMTAEEIVEFMRNPPESQLGGVPMEGVVVKNYAHEMLYGPNLYPFQRGKYVGEAFKEVNKANWKADNTAKGGWEAYKSQFRTEARWVKAVGTMREMGILKGEPSDIGQLMNFVQKDVSEECKEEILAFLWKQFGKELLRVAANGLPEWYKEQLALGNIDV